MVRLIFYVLIVAALVSGAVWLAADPGAVSMTWRGWQIDTSVGVLIATVIAAVVAVLFIARLIALITGKVQAFTAVRRERRMRRGLVRLGDGFAAVQAGQGQIARRLAKEAGALLADNPAVLMLRKDAAALAGDIPEMQAAAEAMLARPETELAGVRVLAQKALAEGDTAGALTQAKRALARKDAPGWALHIAVDMEVAAERWGEALALLDEKLAREAYTATDLKRLRSRLLTWQAQAALAHGDSNAAVNAAKKAMDIDDTNPAAVIVFARAMTAQGKGKKAAAAVERAWAVRAGVDLLAAYKGLVPGESPLDFARRIDALAKAAPDHPETRLAVASASLAAELWGQTRNRLAGLTGTDAAPEIRARAAQLLADVERYERGDADKAAEWLHVAIESQRAPARIAKKPKSAADILAQA